MSPPRAAQVENGEALPLERVPRLDAATFREQVVESVRQGQRVSALFACDAPSAGGQDTELIAVLADRDTASLSLARAAIGREYPALTPDCTQVHLFEREIAEQFGCVPVGHPWLKPVRFQAPLRGPAAPARDAQAAVPGVMDFYRVEGEEVHEVAVGPVHAGVIEPGHFRFQCHGENVFHLEISLGYQHRGVERALPGGPTPRTVRLMETLAGDTTIGHVTAYCHALEGLARMHSPARAQFLRGIALELERIANHVGDLGAIAGDVGFLPTAAFCGRIRGDVLNLTATLCGNRFGRDLARPGGVLCNVDLATRQELSARLDAIRTDLRGAVELLWDTPSVMARLEDTGVIPSATAVDIGLVGPAARACGLQRDVRTEFPKGLYRYSYVPPCTWDTGDVFARTYVRWLEIQNSIRFILDELRDLPEGPVLRELPPLQPSCIVASLVEGWRGEICHVAITDAAGRFSRYKVVDPSFHNWFGVALALRGQQISDFPLCNKSFNLSYAGFDL